MKTMSEFEKLWMSAMSEATAKLDSLSDEELRKAIDESNK
jgi:hypothetical protein